MNEIENKKAEIENYKRILNDYRGRWYDMGRRHLEALENELKELEATHRITSLVDEISKNSCKKRACKIGIQVEAHAEVTNVPINNTSG